MDWPTLLTFTAMATLLVISPGPNGVLVARTVPLSGRRAGCANVAGFVTAFFLHGALSIGGISALLLASSQAFLIVRLLGAAYLCWLGIRALYDLYRGEPGTSLRAVRPQRPRRLVTAYVEGFLTNALNPKVSMFYLAAFPQFITPGPAGIGAACALVLLHALINALWFGAVILLLSRMSAFAGSRRWRRWLQGVTGCAFIGFGIRLASWRPAPL